jgi:hypothetical protein
MNKPLTPVTAGSEGCESLDCIAQVLAGFAFPRILSRQYASAPPAGAYVVSVVRRRSAGAGRSRHRPPLLPHTGWCRRVRRSAPVGCRGRSSLRLTILRSCPTCCRVRSRRLDPLAGTRDRRRGGRGDRPQRRRQDHPDVRHLRTDPPDARQHAYGRHRPRRHAVPPHSRARHRACAGEPPPVPVHDGGG